MSTWCSPPRIVKKKRGGLDPDALRREKQYDVSTSIHRENGDARVFSNSHLWPQKYDFFFLLVHFMNTSCVLFSYLKAVYSIFNQKHSVLKIATSPF